MGADARHGAKNLFSEAGFLQSRVANERTLNHALNEQHVAVAVAAFVTSLLLQMFGGGGPRWWDVKCGMCDKGGRHRLEAYHVSICWYDRVRRSAISSPSHRHSGELQPRHRQEMYIIFRRY